MNIIHQKDFTLTFQLVNVDSTLEENANISFEIFQCDSTSTNLILSQTNINYNSVLNCYSYYINTLSEWENMAIGSYILKWSIGSSITNYPPYMIEELNVIPNNDAVYESLNDLETIIENNQIETNNNFNDIETNQNIMINRFDNLDSTNEIIIETLNNMDIDLKKVLGLVHENLYIDNTVYDEFNNMIGARLRIYSDSISVGTNNNIIATYQIECDSNEPGTFVNWKQILIS